MTLPEIDSDAVLRTFLSLARLDSPSGAEGPVRDYLAQRLDALGVCHRTDATGNLIAEIPPSRCPHPVVLVVCAHMDVVPPCLGVQPQVCGEGDARWIQSDGTTVLGADDKAALAPILEALECSLACAAPRPAVRLIFTVEEETHLKGARQLDDDALRAGFAITFDHTGPPGTLIQRAPFLTTFEITVRGRAAHAGIAPEEGLNAIVLAARVVTRLRQGRLEGETTANIGRIEGGKATNIVPDCVLISGEIRSYRPEAIQDELDCIERVLREETASMPGTSFLLTRERAFDGYAHAPDSPAIQRLTHIIESQGLTPAVIASHGGSDNNVFMTRGLAGVVLSAAMEAPHTVNERAHLTDMMQTARLLLAIWEDFAREPF
ncbi:MAG: M20/M25/M40 family metallo-hydrolase [Vampirovibrionales bacterium]|nr:M20/M25/M40 family metallo-hydrolase [Vampirovibrionales bacterium]